MYVPYRFRGRLAYVTLLVLAPACDCGGEVGEGVDAHTVVTADAGFDAGVADSCAGCDGGGATDHVAADSPGQDSAQTDGAGFDAEGVDTGGLDTEGFDVQGFDADGFDADGFDAESFDAESFDMAGQPPSAPTQLEAIAGAAVRLRFAASARAERYQAFFSLVSGGPYVAAGEAVAQTEILVRGLVPGSPHFFVVRASNASGSSPDSEEVSAIPLAAVSSLRGAIAGTVYRHGVVAAGAVVRLYSELDRGELLAEARSLADGSYLLEAPTGLFRGLVAGLDLPPEDGDPLEVGRDATGVYVPPTGGGPPAALEVVEGETIGGIDVHIAIADVPCHVEGMIWRSAGWPLGPLVVEALSSPGGTRAGFDVLTDARPFSIELPAGSYELQAFLDVDGDLRQGVNEPRERYLTTVNLTTPGCYTSDLDIVFPALGEITGTFSGAPGWSVGAEDERWQLAASYAAAAPDGVEYALAVPSELGFTVHAYLDRDHDGRRSYYDADGDGNRNAADEEWSEPGLPAITGVLAGDSGVDFALGTLRRIEGSVAPAMIPWRVVARDAEGARLFVTDADPDGSFALEVAAHEAYYVYAFEDADGDERRTLGSEPMLLHGAVVDVSSGDATEVEIQRRTLRGTLTGDRSDLGQGQVETVVVQQVVEGVGGGLFCAWPAELNNYTRPATDGSFEVQIGAVGTGAGSAPWSGCQPDCTGVTATRYLDHGADYVHQAEGCGMPLPLTYPASPIDPGVEALVLDSSAGDVNAVSF